MVVDYVDDNSGYSRSNQTRIDDFYSKVRTKSYLPYAVTEDRNLDKINSISGLQE